MYIADFFNNEIFTNNLTNNLNFFMRHFRKHVVFGKVVSGLDLLKKIELAGSPDGKPVRPVRIVDCGETSEAKNQPKITKEKGT